MTQTPTVPTEITPAGSLDCSGLLCPLPVYKTALALGNLQPGEVLELVTTDPGALEDIPAMARQRGDTVLTSEDRGPSQRFLIEKGTQT
jgi:tRNA 2-thiouridine synthesizing protein A